MSKEVFMNVEDYQKLPKLRTFITKPMKEILEKTDILEKADILPRNRRRYQRGERSLPLKYLYKNSETLFQILEKKPVFITHGGTKVVLPNKINEDLAYLSGLICGDGNLFKTNKRDYIVSVHNKEKALLGKAIKIFENNFNYKTVIKSGHDCQFIGVRSEVIYSFFNKIFQIESGRKYNIKIPRKIKNNRKLIRSFIAGFFDAEGTVALQKNNITCQISFSQKQKKILEEIKKELAKDGIRMKFYNYTDTNNWRLFGNKESLKPFFKQIPFSHPRRRKNLETAIKNQIA